MARKKKYVRSLVDPDPTEDPFNSSSREYTIGRIKEEVAWRTEQQHVRWALMLSYIQVLKEMDVDVDNKEVKKAFVTHPTEGGDKYTPIVKVFLEYGIEDDEDIWDSVIKLFREITGKRIAYDYYNGAVMYFAYAL